MYLRKWGPYSCLNLQISDWVYDSHGIGGWKDGPKYCGRNIPPPYNSTSSRVKLLFRSSDVIQGDGFRAIWEQNCGGVFEATGQLQYIESPFYPDEYRPDSVCNYSIIAPPNKEIWVEFLDFELENREYHLRFFYSSFKLIIFSLYLTPLRSVSGQGSETFCLTIEFYCWGAN